MRLIEPSEHKLLAIILAVALVLWITTGTGVAV